MSDPVPIFDPDDPYPSISDVNAGLHNPRESVLRDFKLLALKQPPAHNTKTVFVDIETTGFDRYQDGIIDFACIDEFGGTEYESKVSFCERHDQRFVQKVRDLVGYDADQWLHAPAWPDIIPLVIGALNGRHIVAWNGERFDGPWLESKVAFFGYPRKYVAGHPRTDLMVVCRGLLPGLDSYKLSDVCEHLGIEPETKHRARSGAECVRQVWLKLRELVARGMTA